MMKYFLFFVMLAGGIAANDITLSKDSIWICNSNTSSKTDMVTLINNGPGEAEIDSIGVHFSELDTAGFSYALSNNRFEFLASEIYRDKNLHHYENMKTRRLYRGAFFDERTTYSDYCKGSVFQRRKI